MLVIYLDQAVETAIYEIIEDEGTYWGEIPGLQEIWQGIKLWKDVGVNCESL